MLLRPLLTIPTLPLIARHSPCLTRCVPRRVRRDRADVSCGRAWSGARGGWRSVLSGDEAQVLRARIAAGRQTVQGEVVKTGSASLSALPRREPALPFDERWIERGFELFATVAGGNCAHV